MIFDSERERFVELSKPLLLREKFGALLSFPLDSRWQTQRPVFGFLISVLIQTQIWMHSMEDTVQSILSIFKDLHLGK